MTFPSEAGAPAPSAAEARWLALARARDWRGLAALGRFGLAAQTLRLTDAEAGDDVADALEALTEVEASVRSKAPKRAVARLARLDARPDGLVDWTALEADVVALVDVAAAVDQREPEAARAALERVRSEYFAAERDAQSGTVAVLERDPIAARAHLEAALERDPNHVRALTNRGNLKLEDGDVDGAIADYERAIKLDDGFANAHHNLGVAYRRKGQVGKSVAALRRAQRASSKRDAEEARASLARGGNAGSRRWLRPALLGGAVLAALWWWSSRGGP
ncbi:MAG: tetratricopeptide repeat protein [Trueperaceae bacterium]